MYPLKKHNLEIIIKNKSENGKKKMFNQREQWQSKKEGKDPGDNHEKNMWKQVRTDASK